MSIPKSKLLKMIRDEQDKIKQLEEKGVGLSPAQVRCEMKIKTCEELLKW